MILGQGPQSKTALAAGASNRPCRQARGPLPLHQSLEALLAGVCRLGAAPLELNRPVLAPAPTTRAPSQAIGNNNVVGGVCTCQALGSAPLLQPLECSTQPGPLLAHLAGNQQLTKLEDMPPTNTSIHNGLPKQLAFEKGCGPCCPLQPLATCIQLTAGHLLRHNAEQTPAYAGDLLLMPEEVLDQGLR